VAGGSTFIVRVDDLDPVASSRDHERSQLADLRDLGLDWDGPVVRQSERLDLYLDALASLRATGALYPCWCTRREIAEATQAPNRPDLPDGAYPGTCRELSAAQRSEVQRAGRPAAWRLRADGQRRAFVDAIHGPTSGVIDDFVVQRNDGMPAYNLAVVVDDAAQGVEQVVRGDDLLSSTPRQILLEERLGVPAEQWAHVPLVLNAAGTRLAKRDGAVTLADQAARGRTALEIVGVFAHSLGLLDRPQPVAPAALVEGFSLGRLPRLPFTLPADLL
jgi:glutamyl-tRNA synthetase